MSSCLHPGVGSFAFPDPSARASGAVRVFYACPDGDARAAPMVIGLHGVDRAAEAFRDSLADRARRNGQIVLVPEFDAHQFPDVHAYNFGGVRLPPPDNAARPRQDWNFGLIDRLFAHARGAVGSDRTTFGMFGLSAGSQYVLRYLALTEAAAVGRAVAANSGVYMLPDLQTSYPTGMGGLDLGEEQLRRYLARPLTILLGDADTDPTAPDLPRGEVAMAQGPHRLARGRWHFEHCTALARQLGGELAWRLEIAEGAGHVSQGIYDRALDILASEGRGAS